MRSHVGLNGVNNLTTQNDEIFTPKRKRIERIAKVANLFAWLVLIFYTFRSFSEGYAIISEYGYMRNIERNIAWVINFSLRILYIQFIGIVYWLVLRGVSLGLNMLLEIDLNYQLKTLGEDNE